MSMPAKDVFRKVLSDAIKNVIFFGAGALLIAFIGNGLSFRILGLLLASLFTIVVLVSLIPFIFSFVVGLIVAALAIVETAKGDKREFGGQGYLWAGTIVQLAENIICLLYILYLYRVFFV